MGVSLDHGVLLCFISLLANMLATFRANNNVRSALASSSFTLVSNQSHNARTANGHLRAKGERNGVQTSENKGIIKVSVEPW